MLENKLTTTILLLITITCLADGRYVIDGACCDYYTNPSGFAQECNSTTDSVLMSFISTVNGPRIPMNIRDQWYIDEAGEVQIECNPVPSSMFNNCKTACFNDSESAIYCSGDALYRSLYNTTLYGQCVCRAERGVYGEMVRLVPNTPEAESVKLNCSYGYVVAIEPVEEPSTLAARSILSVPDGGNLPENTTTESVYWEITDSDLILIFNTDASRIISFACKTKTHVHECSTKNCLESLVDVCIQGEPLSMTIYNGFVVTQRYMTCPTIIVEKCPVAQGWFDTSRYSKWSCLTTLEKAFAVLGLIYLIAAIIWLLSWVMWVCTPVAYLLSMVKYGCIKARRFKKLRVYKRASQFAKSKFSTMKSVLEEDPDAEMVEVSLSSPTSSSPDSGSPYNSDDNEEKWTKIISRTLSTGRSTGPSRGNRLMIVLFMFGLFGVAKSVEYSTDCTDSFSILGAAVVNCIEDRGTRTCSVSPDITGFLPYINSVHCYEITDEKGIVGNLYVQYQRHTTYVDLRSNYYTAQTENLSQSVKRCDGTDNCSSEECSAMTASNSNANGELTGDVTSYPGITYCDASCGCAGCGCFLCSDGCMFSRAAYKPVSPYGVSKEPINMRQDPRILVTWVSGNGEVRQEVVRGVGTRSVGPFSATILGNFVGSLALFGDNKINVDLTYNKAYYGPASSPAHPEPGKFGHIQANTLALLQTTGTSNFVISPNAWVKSVGADSVTFTFADSGWDKVWIQKVFPITISGQVWSYGGTTLANENTAPGTLTYFLKATSPLTFVRQVDSVCVDLRSNYTTGGCSSCLSGSFVSVSAKSFCSPGFAFVTLKDSKYDGSNSANLITTSIYLNTTFEDHKIYFANDLESLTAEICLRADAAERCISFTGEFPSDIDVGENNFTNSNNKKDNTTTDLTWWESVEDWFENAWEDFSDFFDSNWEWMVAVLVVVAALITTLLVVKCLFNNRSNPKVQMVWEKTKDVFKKKKAKTEDDELDQLLQASAKDVSEVKINRGTTSLRKKGWSNK